jgi:hypothetical protein
MAQKDWKHACLINYDDTLSVLIKIKHRIFRTEETLSGYHMEKPDWHPTAQVGSKEGKSRAVSSHYRPNYRGGKHSSP